MKKYYSRFLFFICLLLFSIVFIIINKEQSYGNYEVELVDSISDKSEKIKICLLNENDKLEIVNVNVKKTGNYDEITYLIKLFDEYRNSLPINYKTTLFESINIKSLKRDNDILFIEIEKIGSKTNVESFLTSLMWSYKYLGIKHLEVKIGKKIFKIDADVKINPVIFSTTSTHSVIYYEFTDYGMIPYTLFHNKGDLEVLLDMLSAKKNIISENNFKYSIDNKNNLKVYVEEKLSQQKLEEIKYNLSFLDYNSISIFVNGKLEESVS